MYFLITITATFLFLPIHTILASNELQPHIRLYRDLMADYDSDLEPAFNETLIVDVDYQMTKVLDLDESDESLTFKQLVRMSYIDPRLSWNPANYSGITMRPFPAKIIWKPPFSSLAINSRESIDDVAEIGAILTYQGMISLSIHEVISVHCKLDVTQFPFDTQICEIDFRTSYMIQQLQFKVSVKAGQESNPLAHSIGVSEWVVKGCDVVTKLYSPTELFKFSQVSVTLRLKRKPGFYTLTQIIPAAIITCLTLIGLFTPSSHQRDRSERVTIGLTALLALAVVVSDVNSTMPKDASKFPKLGRFMMYELIIVSVSTCVAVGIMIMHSWYNEKRQVPDLLSRLLGVKKPKITHSSMKVYMSTPGDTALENKVTIIRHLVESYIDEININESITSAIGTVFYRLDFVFLVLTLSWNIFSAFEFIFEFGLV